MRRRRSIRCCWTSLPVAHERAHEAETRNELGPVGRGENRCTGAHGVAHDSGQAAQLLHESDDVARRLHVAVAGEARVAVAVAPQVGPRHPEAGVNNRGGKKPVRATQVAHAGDEHDQRPGSGHLIGDTAPGSGEVPHFLHASRFV
jgi:hypothetical protein